MNLPRIIAAISVLILCENAFGVGLCSGTFRALFLKKRIQEEYVKDGIEFVWYPTGLTSKLFVDGRYIETSGGIHKTFHKINEIVGVANPRVGGAHGGSVAFHFKLRVTKEEMQKVKDYIRKQNGKMSLQSCSGGACKVIRKNTDIIMPNMGPYSHIPMFSGIYLTIMKVFGYKRIHSLTIHRANDTKKINAALQTLIAPAASDGLIAVIPSTGIYILYLIVENKLGDLVNILIPVEVKD